MFRCANYGILRNRPGPSRCRCRVSGAMARHMGSVLGGRTSAVRARRVPERGLMRCDAEIRRRGAFENTGHKRVLYSYVYKREACGPVF